MPIYQLNTSTINLLDPQAGTIQLQGQCSGVELPEIEPEYSDDARLGRYGAVAVPVGIGVPETTITFSAFDERWARAIARFNSFCTFQFRGALQDADGVAANKSYVVTVRGRAMNIPLGKFEAQKPGEWEVGLKTHYVRQVVNDIEVLLYDAIANRYAVDGVDQLASIRTILGV